MSNFLYENDKETDWVHALININDSLLNISEVMAFISDSILMEVTHKENEISPKGMRGLYEVVEQVRGAIDGIFTDLGQLEIGGR